MLIYNTAVISQLKMIFRQAQEDTYLPFLFTASYVVQLYTPLKGDMDHNK